MAATLVQEACRRLSLTFKITNQDDIRFLHNDDELLEVHLSFLPQLMYDPPTDIDDEIVQNYLRNKDTHLETLLDVLKRINDPKEKEKKRLRGLRTNLQKDLRMISKKEVEELDEYLRANDGEFKSWMLLRKITYTEAYRLREVIGYKPNPSESEKPFGLNIKEGYVKLALCLAKELGNSQQENFINDVVAVANVIEVVIQDAAVSVRCSYLPSSRYI